MFSCSDLSSILLSGKMISTKYIESSKESIDISSVCTENIFLINLMDNSDNNEWSCFLPSNITISVDNHNCKNNCGRQCENKCNDRCKCECHGSYFYNSSNKKITTNFVNFCESLCVSKVVYPNGRCNIEYKSRVRNISEKGNFIIENNTFDEDFYMNWRECILDTTEPLIDDTNVWKKNNYTEFYIPTTKYGNYIRNEVDGEICKEHNYVSARKNIFVKEYIKSIRQVNRYDCLLRKLKYGQHIIICDKNVPTKDCSENGLCNMSIDKLESLLNNPNENFGYSLALAYSLLKDFERSANGLKECYLCEKIHKKEDFLKFRCGHFMCTDCFIEINKNNYYILSNCHRCGSKGLANNKYFINIHDDCMHHALESHPLYSEEYRVTNKDMYEHYRELSILKVIFDLENFSPIDGLSIVLKIKASNIEELFVKLYECKFIYDKIIGYFKRDSITLYTSNDHVIGDPYDKLFIRYDDYFTHGITLVIECNPTMMMTIQCTNNVYIDKNYRKIDVDNEICKCDMKINHEHFKMLFLFLNNHAKKMGHRDRHGERHISWDEEPTIFIVPNDLEHYYFYSR